MAVFQRPKRRPDWSDTHSGPMARPDWTARQVWEYAEGHMPRWVDAAFAIRNAIVRPFGLHTGDGELLLSQLPVVEETPTAFETGMADKHLTFTLRTETRDGLASVTTRIWFNHWLGRLYLGAVWIGHKLILRHAIKSIGTLDDEELPA